MANNNNKPWYEKVNIWVTIVAGLVAIVVGIFTILGVSIFGGKSILRDNQTDAISIYDEKESSRYYKGIIHDKSWESEFIGLRYTAPKGMSMSTAEELDELMELDREIFLRTSVRIS